MHSGIILTSIHFYYPQFASQFKFSSTLGQGTQGEPTEPLVNQRLQNLFKILVKTKNHWLFLTLHDSPSQTDLFSSQGDPLNDRFLPKNLRM